MDPEVAAELKAMEEVEIQASQPGSMIVLQGRHDAFAEVRGRDKGGRVRCLGSGIEPQKYWGEGSSTKPTTEPNAEILNRRQQLENTLAELQAAKQRIAKLEALLVVHDESRITNTDYQAALDRIAELEAQLRTYKTVTPSTDAEIRNSP
ncbi:hypothetical protein MKW98_014438 [Papaver atlanticum]|uniref:Uncharacterized protein n=1 Tax=Papaver atlanticum TaxID=357466 RepID=A0AAD4SA65_9MAGN|nr:hypothetical protein MKW98_014438 [Papaver atlanticum]